MNINWIQLGSGLCPLGVLNFGTKLKKIQCPIAQSMKYYTPPFDLPNLSNL